MEGGKKVLWNIKSLSKGAVLAFAKGGTEVAKTKGGRTSKRRKKRSTSGKEGYNQKKRTMRDRRSGT